MGHRLNTSKSLGAYQTLIYNKGALVLRMIQFLLSDPSTGDDKLFYGMMKDFVNRHRNNTATTEDFLTVASSHFARSPIAKKYKLTDLNWFFRQWVYETGLPTYSIEYSTEATADGSTLVSGNVFQTGVDDKWFMPVPLVFNFGGNSTGSGTVASYGPKTPFQIKLQSKPVKVEIDPYKWILSEKTSIKALN